MTNQNTYDMNFDHRCDKTVTCIVCNNEKDYKPNFNNFDDVCDVCFELNLRRCLDCENLFIYSTVDNCCDSCIAKKKLKKTELTVSDSNISNEMKEYLYESDKNAMKCPDCEAAPPYGPYCWKHGRISPELKFKKCITCLNVLPYDKFMHTHTIHDYCANCYGTFRCKTCDVIRPVDRFYRIGLSFSFNTKKCKDCYKMAHQKKFTDNKNKVTMMKIRKKMFD